MSQPILSSMISSNATSAAPKPPVSAINGRLLAPPPEFSCRTRREIRLTSTFGLPTLAKACLQNSLFKNAFRLIGYDRAAKASGWAHGRQHEKARRKVARRDRGQ